MEKVLFELPAAIRGVEDWFIKVPEVRLCRGEGLGEGVLSVLHRPMR
jgi:hypothetical protein